MFFFRDFAVAMSAMVLACLPACASHRVTGNGCGFAVVSPETATVSKFYAHAYSFGQPDPQNPLSEGFETANFIKSLSWSDGASSNASAEYEEESHVVYARSSAGDGFYFMPFGFERAALVISWEPGVAKAGRGGFDVEWARPVRSLRVVRLFDTEMQLLGTSEELADPQLARVMWNQGADRRCIR
jgi:hypothetical protein